MAGENVVALVAAERAGGDEIDGRGVGGGAGERVVALVATQRAGRHHEIRGCDARERVVARTTGGIAAAGGNDRVRAVTAVQGLVTAAPCEGVSAGAALDRERYGRPDHGRAIIGVAELE